MAGRRSGTHRDRGRIHPRQHRAWRGRRPERRLLSAGPQRAVRQPADPQRAQLPRGHQPRRRRVRRRRQRRHRPRESEGRQSDPGGGARGDLRQTGLRRRRSPRRPDDAGAVSTRPCLPSHRGRAAAKRADGARRDRRRGHHRSPVRAGADPARLRRGAGHGHRLQREHQLARSVPQPAGLPAADPNRHHRGPPRRLRGASACRAARRSGRADRRSVAGRPERMSAHAIGVGD